MITNLGELKRAHRELIRNTEISIQKALDDAWDEVQKHVSSTSRFVHRTGAVKSGMRRKFIRLKSGARLEISNRVRHATFLERGTRPHPIVAKRGRALRFMVGGQVFFRRRVFHPGTKPTFFLRDATHSAWVRAGVTLRRSMRRHASRF